jgi:hypothetical protein
MGTYKSSNGGVSFEDNSLFQKSNKTSELKQSKTLQNIKHHPSARDKSAFAKQKRKQTEESESEELSGNNFESIKLQMKAEPLDRT